jgi:hypothetical protein
VNVRPGDGERALDALRAAGVHEDLAEDASLPSGA